MLMLVKKFLKITGKILAGVVVVVGTLVVSAKLQYGSRPLIPHKRISITLPYGPENEINNLIPMGETIEHNFKGGHPGIDFQWDHPAPLIAVADGKITSVYEDTDKGKPILSLVLTSGEYEARYKELDKLAPNLREGSEVKKGDIVAYPHCSTFEAGRVHCQLHWEFAYSSKLAMLAGITSGIDRLCPLTYFDDDSLRRINDSWDKVPDGDKFKKDFPHICSGGYLGRDQ